MSGVLGLSHLCFGAMQAGRPAIFEELGYADKFFEPGLANPAEKKPFMATDSPGLAVRLVVQPGAASLELLRHSSPSGPGPETYVMFAGCPAALLARYPRAGDDSAALALQAAFGAPVHALGVEGPARLLALDAGALGRSGVAGVLCAVPAPDASLDFWRAGFGFSEHSRAGDSAWMRLQLASFVPGWGCQLVAYQAAGLPAGHIDDHGCACMSFITRDIVAAHAALAHCGASMVGDVFAQVVGGVRVEAFFARGPQGELVEVLQLF